MRVSSGTPVARAPAEDVLESVCPDIGKALRARVAKRLLELRCKPRRAATNEERLDGENGILLTPNADHLFDRGFIGFENNGDVLISPVADTESLKRIGLDLTRSPNVGRFGDG